MSNLTIIEGNRNVLAEAIAQSTSVIKTLSVGQQENFKKNFLEFANQEYLLSVVSPKEIIRFAVNVTKLGLDIAPSSNEVYIIPFDTKINGVKVMLPQAIVPLNGMQQLAYQSGFMLTVDPVYKFTENDSGAARNLSRNQQSNLDTANPAWLNKHFIGYDVLLKDLKGDLGEQIYFVDVSYVKAATKTNKDAKWSLSTWTHKAVRKAYKQFLVPRDRSLEKFEKIEHLNDEVISDIDIVSSSVLNDKIEQAVKQLGLGLLKKEGTATITGSTYGKDDIIAQLGFVKNNKTWGIEYIDTIAAEVVEKEHPQLPKKALSPARELMTYLVSKNIAKDRVREFVVDVLGTTSADTKGIETALKDKPALDEMIEIFNSEPTEGDIEADKVFQN